jgi:hypothetical protein
MRGGDLEFGYPYTIMRELGKPEINNYDQYQDSQL